MDINQKSRIREIIKEHMNRIGDKPEDNFPLFDFVLFQAMLPDNQHDVIIKEEEVFTITGIIDKNHNDF